MPDHDRRLDLTRSGSAIGPIRTLVPRVQLSRVTSPPKQLPGVIEPVPPVPLGDWDRRAMLAHELDGSVASIRAIARVLAESVPRDHQHGLPAVLIDEAERLTMLIDDARRLRGEPRTVPLPREPVDVATTLAIVRDYAFRMQPSRPVYLSLDPVTRLWSGSPGRLTQVLRTLIDNALRYTPPDSPIELRLITLTGRLEVAVVDHGPGLSPEDAARVFLPYVRTGTATGISGSGLGLALCRTLVEGWEGHIWSEATPGGGATFSFTLRTSGV